MTGEENSGPPGPATQAATRTPEEAELERRLGFYFSSIELRDRALCDRSYAFEAGGVADQERLEVLGDAVLGLIVPGEIFHRLPDAAEGRLAKVRAAAVNTLRLAQVARA